MRTIGVVATLAVAVFCACGDAGGAGGADAAVSPDAASSDAATAVEVALTTYHLSAPITVPATWLAVQDGDGPWQRLDSDDGHYRFSVSDRRYSVAVMCDNDTTSRLYITRATTDELPSLWHECSSTSAAGELEVSVLGAEDRPTPTIVVRNSGRLAAGATFSNLAPAHYDVLALADDDRDGLPDELAFDRDVPVAAGSTSGATVDLTRAAATSPFSVTVTGAVDPGSLLGHTRYVTARGTRWVLSDAEDLSRYRGLPAEAVGEGDRHVVYARGSVDTDHQAAWMFLQGARDVNLELPSPFALSSVSVAATEPSLRVQATFDAYPGASFYQLEVRHHVLLVTPGWLGAGERHTLEQPDLSEVEGWQDDWALPDDVQHSFTGAAYAGPVYPGHLDGFGYTRGEGVPDGTMATRAGHGGSFRP